MTVLDLIKSSMRLAGVLASGEDPTAEEAADALLALNDMLDSWRCDRLMVYSIRRAEYQLTPGKAQYTIGAGGDIDTDRPVRIESVGVVVDGAERQIDVIDSWRWAHLPMKTQSGTPLSVHYERSAPLGVLHFAPVPDSPLRCALYTWSPIGAFSEYTEAIQLPSGYQRAVRYNLAVELAAEYGRPVDEAIAAIAAEAKAAIAAAHLETPLMSCDPAVLECGMRP